MKNRRTFIALGASAGAAALFGMPARTSAQLTPPCTQPWPNGTTGTPWTRPYGQQVINRISAYDPSYNWTRLNAAYAAMRALPASDPRSLVSQQNVHAWYCATCPGSTADIHFHWTFFVWHRAFLYFHERILGQLVNDTTLRLPYWDYENAARQNMPSGYTGQTALMDPTRALQPGQTVQRNVPGWGIYNLVSNVPQLISDDFTGIGGDATTAGDVETGPHGYVHMSVGGNNGDMGNLELAAGDPIFFTHHSNVDRMWYSWENYNGNTNPPGLSAIPPYLFYDGSAWRTMGAAQMSPASNIGYNYDTKITPPGSLFRHVIPLLVQQNRLIKPPPPPELRAIANSRAALVTLRGVEVRSAGPTVVSVTTATGTHDIGTIFVVPHGKHTMPMARRTNVRFLVPAGLASALAQPNARLTVRTSAAANGRLEATAPIAAKLSAATISVR